nr:exodeoxyribonuclease V subunit gamma [Lujinxingiaceae bacterium]
MLHVFHSNQVERLVDALVANIRRTREIGNSGGIFQKVDIVVPNWNLQTYLKFQIASRSGIAANFRFRALEQFLASCVPAEVRSEFEIVTDKAVQHLLVELLSDAAFLANSELGAIRGYLAAMGTSADSLEMRRFQLARELARLFREYDYSRRDMLGAWKTRCVIEKEPFDEVERWQRIVWLAVFGPEGRLA